VDASGSDPGKRCRRSNPNWTPTPAPGTSRHRWMSRPPDCCSVRSPQRFHAGVQDILLIAYALACAEFLDDGDTTVSASTFEGHGRDEDLAPGVDLSRTVGWFTTKYPVALTVGGLRGRKSKPAMPHYRCRDQEPQRTNSELCPTT